MTAQTQAQRSASTQEAIIVAARDLFAERGYDGAGLEEIARTAGVSKGALYHHFPDKAEVLAAVYESLEADLCDRLIARFAGEADPVVALRTGAQAFLDACRDPVLRRIALTEAPAVLGWSRWREIDARYGFGLLKAGLQAAADDGRGSLETVDERAHLLLAALMEACLLIGATDDLDRTRSAVGAAINDLIGGLTPSPSVVPSAGTTGTHRTKRAEDTDVHL